MAYQKHQLYLDKYEVSSGGVVNLPDDCNWIVMRYLDWGHFTNATSGELGHPHGICLILNATRTETEGFWPVMSFLTKKEARELSKELAKHSK